jgi:hypothetical protein
MSIALKKSANLNFWGEKLLRTRFQLTTMKIYIQSIRYRRLRLTYLLLIGIYNTLFQRDIKEVSICLCSKLPPLSSLLICLGKTTQRLMERRGDDRIGKASGLLLNLPHGMSGLRVTTNYVSQVGQLHNLNSVRTEALYYAM